MNLTSGAAASHTLAPADWALNALQVVGSGETGVLVFVARHYGSTPRDKGSWMFIRADVSLGTLGGGEVERVVEAAARDMIADRRPWTRVHEKFMLGPDMGQCCGGGMEVVFEPVDHASLAWLTQAEACIASDEPGFVVVAFNDPECSPTVNKGLLSSNIDEAKGIHIQSLGDTRPSLVIYGAGHVARAFAGIAAQLPVQLTIVDDRLTELDLVPEASNVTTVFMEYPLAHAAALDASTAAVLVMTYSHALDYRLCLELLKKQELSYIGLIGSKSKAARFRRRFDLDDGLAPVDIARLVSPIGSGPVRGKEPGLIALASLNEIMATLDNAVELRTQQMNEMI